MKKIKECLVGLSLVALLSFPVAITAQRATLPPQPAQVKYRKIPNAIANNYIVDYDHPAWGPIQVMGHPVILSETPADPKAPAPEFGEHTEQILIDTLGYSWEEVAQLKEQEVI